MADAPPYPGVPRWVKVSGIVGIVLVLLVIIVALTGGHGPGRHTPFGDHGAHTPPIEHGTQHP